MKMKSKNFAGLFFLCCCVILGSCTSVTPDYGQEAVLIHKPWMFGHGGVDETPVETGLAYTWLSTDYVTVNMLPQKYDETLDDVTSNDNTLLDFNTQIQLQVKNNKSAVLVANYGLNWYDNVVRERYRNTVRNYISKYGPFDLMSNREVLDSINQMVKNDIIQHIASVSEKSGELPLDTHETHILCVLSEGAKTALGYCVHAPLEKLFSFNISDDDMRLFTRAAEEYILNQLGRSYKSLDFYKSVR